MTEQEWLACEDPRPMLDLLRGKAGERKLRLFAVACCRRIWRIMQDEPSRGAVEAAERFAHRGSPQTLLAVANREAREVLPRTAGLGVVPSTAARYCSGLHVNGWDVAATTAVAASMAVPPPAGRGGPPQGPVPAPLAGIPAEGLRERAAQAALLRCVFGSPFRPVTAGPWVTPAAVTVARDCYDRRDFAALPLLADLLEEAGCPEQSVLDHCRTPGEHARGCWAVDLVLGKG
jgi:hypothetical protein